MRYTGHAESSLGDAIAIMVVQHRFGIRVLDNRSAKRTRDRVDADVIVCWSDAACGKDIVVSGTAGIDGGDNRPHLVRDDARFAELDTLNIQPFAKISEVRILCASREDFVADNDQRGGPDAGCVDHAQFVACRAAGVKEHDSVMKFSGRVGLALLICCALPVAAHAQGAEESCAVTRDPMSLAPGEFVWSPQVAPTGPLFIVISLPQQRAFVYRNGVQIGVSTVSTGRKGYETPTGLFTVLEKDADHRSNLYDDAPMPFMLRLTWGGVAIHAGRDPGYPQSHGCIRLPLAFAKSLFEAVPHGTQVVVTDRAIDPGLRVTPTMFARGKTVTTKSKGDHWSPELAPTGHVAIVISGADQTLSVMRGGVEIGRTRIWISGDEPLHTHALMLTKSDAKIDSVKNVSGAGAWMLIDLPGDAALPEEARHSHDIDRIAVPPGFSARLRAILKPGTTMLISDLPMDTAEAPQVRLIGEGK